MAERVFRVAGMDCADCAANIEKNLARLEGVNAVRVDFGSGLLRIEGSVSPERVIQRVARLGYTLETAGRHAAHEPRSRFGGLAGFVLFLFSRMETRLALVGGAVLLCAVIALLLNAPPALVDALCAAAACIAGLPIARSGLRLLIFNRDINVNLLMTIAAAGALAIGETLEAASVIFLFAIGEALESFTVNHAREGIRDLMRLTPAQTTVLQGASEILVPVEALKPGDVMLIKAGEAIPTDGIVRDGASEVNQAPITGESMPVLKQAGTAVYAGTVNGSGALTVEVTAPWSESTLSRIIELVEQAGSMRARSQRFVDRFARIYTPAVVFIALLIAVVPPLLFGGSFSDPAPGERGSLYRALTLLVIACPCALVISTPVTVISAITAAARRGVLIKGGLHLENLGMVRTFAFDKTGTLTHGRPVVLSNRAADCETGLPCAVCDDVLALASALERRSAHPLARAITQAALERGLDGRYPAAASVETFAGQGIAGLVNERRVMVGSHSYFDVHCPHPAALCEDVEAAEARGQTVMLVSHDDRVVGYIAAADTVRENSAAIIRELQALGTAAVLLTGDNAAVAHSIARQMGIDSVHAGLLPADKMMIIRDLETHGPAAMVGDGINDAPALAAATVGIAMGAAGSAQALETADIALMADDLRQLPFAWKLSRFAGRIIRENIVLSLGTKAVFFGLALGGGTSLWMAILADVGMSLLVTLNGMRPLAFAATPEAN